MQILRVRETVIETSTAHQSEAPDNRAKSFWQTSKWRTAMATQQSRDSLPDQGVASASSGPYVKPSDIEGLRKENDELRDLVIQLTKIVIRNIAEQK
jgi:hypothetical protein